MGVNEVIYFICFDHHSESNPDIVFNKNYFLSFLFKMLLLHETPPHSSVYKNKSMKLLYIYIYIYIRAVNQLHVLIAINRMIVMS